MTFEEICSAFGAMGSGDRRKCKCPAHKDVRASLSISRGRNGGTVIHCQAGCKTEDVLASRGLKLSDLGSGDYSGDVESWKRYLIGRGKKKYGDSAELDDVYHYRDLNGCYAYSKIRYRTDDGKEILYGILKDDRITLGLGGRSRESWLAVFCRSIGKIREAAENGSTVYLVEGEKDVRTLDRKGLLAVTVGGCKDWKAGFADLFSGVNVVILADNDAPGLVLAAAEKADLESVAAAVKVIVPDRSALKADITDWFEAGHTDEEFRTMISGNGLDDEEISELIRVYEADRDEDQIEGLFNVADLIGINLREKRPELIEGILREGHIGILSGASKVGKSFASIELACAVASGNEWIGHICKQGRVLYVNFELDDISVAHRFQKVVTSMQVEIGREVRILQLRGRKTSAQDLCDELARICESWKPSLVIIDPIYRLIDGDENSAVNVAELFSYIDGLAQRSGAAVLLVHHHSKGGQAGKTAMDRSSGSGVFARSPDAILDILELEISREMERKLTEEYGACAVFSKCTGFRVEMTLREFRSPDPLFGWFEYPLHMIDSKQILKDARTAIEARAADSRRAMKRQPGIMWESAIPDAMERLKERDEVTTVEKVADLIGCAESTLKDHIRECGYSQVKGIIRNRSLNE